MANEILLVEDNPDDEHLILRALAGLKLVNPIQVAHDGAEALEILFGNTPGNSPRSAPILTILDLKLPKIGGLDVLKIIRTTPAIRLLPVIILTSSNEHQDILNAYDFGANSYVRKPVDSKAFQQAITTIGLYWAMTNEPPPKN